MAGMFEDRDRLKVLMVMVSAISDELQGAVVDVRDVRKGVEVVGSEDEVILARINEHMSPVGFLVIRSPRSNASSGTDPWDR
jgi:hypothetical protein